MKYPYPCNQMIKKIHYLVNEWNIITVPYLWKLLILFSWQLFISISIGVKISMHDLSISKAFQT
jgi:hypothetical protein